MNNQLLCEDCGWTGEYEDCVEVSPQCPMPIGLAERRLQCPKCSSEKLIELMGRKAVLEPVLAR